MDINLINNPWVIGIVGGLIVTAMSRYLFSKKDNKEYRQKIVTANQEILYAIRPGVSEGKMASLEVFEALVSATSTKYNVEKNDLYKPRDIANHLIKEVMDSSFISVELKHQYCEELAKLKVKDIESQPLEVRKEVGKESSNLSEYRQKFVSMISVMLGVMTTVTTVFVVFFEEYKDGDGGLFDKDISTLIPTLAVLFTVMITALIMPIFTQLIREKEKYPSKSESVTSNVESEDKTHNK